ncbi:MAG: hypothetical protein ACP5QG_05065 [candidate division WOR-3 bacterium]
MTEDEVLELWEQISGYNSDWDSIIMDLLDEIDSMLSQMTVTREDDEYGSYSTTDDSSPDLQHLRDTLVDLRKIISNEVNSALTGETVKTELAEFFARASETLHQIETKVFELRELTGEFDIYEMEEDMWEEEEGEEE